MTRERQRLYFQGRIVGLGSTSGVRIVVGHWHRTPMGPFSDAMVARPDGRRILLAPSEEVARFIAATYTFDEIRVEPFHVLVVGSRWQVRSDSLRLDLTMGRRTALGWLLRMVPRPVAHAPRWISVVDLIARVVLRGVRVAGATINGRKEWYGATDNCSVDTLGGAFDGEDVGELAFLTPAPNFGFSSTPPRPSVTTLRTTVELPGSGTEEDGSMQPG